MSRKPSHHDHHPHHHFSVPLPEPTSDLTFTLPYTTDSPDPTMTSDRCHITIYHLCALCTLHNRRVPCLTNSIRSNSTRPPSRAARRRREARYRKFTKSFFYKSQNHTLTLSQTRLLTPWINSLNHTNLSRPQGRPDRCSTSYLSHAQTKPSVLGLTLSGTPYHI